MAIYVNTNTQSIFAQRALGGNTFDLQKSIEKLSTGYRINRAADDAAGLSISEKLTTQIIRYYSSMSNIFLKQLSQVLDNNSSRSPADR